MNDPTRTESPIYSFLIIKIVESDQLSAIIPKEKAKQLALWKAVLQNYANVHRRLGNTVLLHSQFIS